ncbi:hypothetical protein Hanom_Chr08g00728671 [Helianthus anomalus]
MFLVSRLRVLRCGCMGRSKVEELAPDKGGTSPSLGEASASPVRGIGLKIANIEGNPLMARRGMFKTSNLSVIDGLYEISKPVDLEYKGGNDDEHMAANFPELSFAKPKSTMLIRMMVKLMLTRMWRILMQTLMILKRVLIRWM